MSSSGERALPQTETSVWRATAAVGLTQVVSGVLTLASTALLSRLLGSQGMGLYATFLVSVTLLALFADPLGYRWVNTYVVRRGSPVRTAVRRSTLYAAGVLVASSLLFGLGAAWVVGQLERLGLWTRWQALEPLLPLVALALPLVLFHGYIAAILLGLEAYRDFNGVALLTAASQLAALAGLWLAGGQMDARLAVWLWTASYAVGAAWGLLRVWRARIGRGGQGRAASGVEVPFAEVAGTGFRAFSVNILGFLHLRADIYLVGFFLTPADVGLYAVAVSFAELLTRLPGLVGTVIFPKSAGEPESGEREGEIARLIGRLLKLLPLVAVVAIPVFWLVGRRLLELLFGVGFGASFPAAFWLLPGVLCLSGGVLINNFLAGKGYPWVLHLAAAAGLLANLGLNWLWIPRYGIRGAALASSVSYGVWLLLLGVHFYRRFVRAARRSAG